MLGDVDDIRTSMVARAGAAFAAEIDRHPADAAIPWPLWPNVATLIDHLGRNHLWAAGIVRSGGPVDRKTLPRASAEDPRGWYEGCRAELLETLAETPMDRPCWVVGGRDGGTAAFWARRMVYETTKHLIDIRASGGGEWTAAPELSPVDYADGIDELFAEFLPRSRASLEPLPGTLVLAASDIDRAWSISPDWAVAGTPATDAAARVTATAGDLALFAWERATPWTAPARFAVDGPDPAVVRAFGAAPVHP
ncbi:maleylpyruvate isomerase N-terminal domain-containing protein [Microbacter sp. GSS18]|nr:maleylpyruvate isomerase N-terminal domain-containing protein [Microbacter sp. GSS18]